MNNEESKQNSGINELDLGSTATEFDPFGSNPFEEPDFEELTEENEVQAENSDAACQNTENKPLDPLAQAMSEVETKEAEEAKKSLFEKPPIFSYAAADEEIDDTSKTLEELRIEKAVDFPELDDGKRVSWTIEYDKITKAVSNPKGTTIAKIKSDIEKSKEFIDALKKSKDKEPACKLKPKVTAQSKGKVSSYKGVFTTMEAAETAGKIISLFPAKDGKVYEMRKNEIGKFITPSAGSDMLSEVKAGFIPALPPVPNKHLIEIISFFRKMALNGSCEALVNLYWDKETLRYITDVPKQTVTPVSVESSISLKYDNDRYIHYMDIHSHNKMDAFFSETDDNDEKATRVYAVIGKIFDYFPEMRVRISNGGTFLEISPELVFESVDENQEYPNVWNNQIKRINGEVTSKNILSYLGFSTALRKLIGGGAA